MRWCLFTLVVAGFSLAGAGAQGGAKGDQERIQGTWQVLSDEEGGRKAPDEAIKDVKWVITRDKITQKICFPKGGKGKRSTAFEPKPNSGNEILIILKREEP